MAKTIKTLITIGGKLLPSLQQAFKAAGKHTAALDKAYAVTQKVGVNAFKAVAAAATAVGTAVIASAEATRDYRKDLAKMMNNAEMAGVSQEKAWSGLEELYAMSGEFDSANEAMSNLLATGYKGKDLTKIIEAVNGATVKWQDTISQEGLADAINETVMSGKSIGQFDEILSRSGVNIDTFNDGLLACNGLAERQQYVLSWLAKSGLTEVNSAYQEQNESLVNAYKADLKYQDSMAKLGEVADTIMPSIKGLAADGISYFAEKLKGVDVDTITTAVNNFGAIGKQAFDSVWNALSQIDWQATISSLTIILQTGADILAIVSANLPTILPLLLSVGGAIVALKTATTAWHTAQTIVNNAQKAYATISSLVVKWYNAQKMATLGLTTATTLQGQASNKAALSQRILNAVMKANPIGIVITVIGLLVTAFVTLYNKCDWFREFWDKTWEAIKKTVSTVVESISKILEGIGGVLSNLFGGGSKDINVNVNNSGEAAQNAIGSTITRPTLTWVGEGGEPETIVPHNNAPRSRALALEAVKGTGLNIGGNTYVFSPTIYANGGSTSDLESLLTAKFNEFKSQLEAYEGERRRLAY